MLRSLCLSRPGRGLLRRRRFTMRPSKSQGQRSSRAGSGKAADAGSLHVLFEDEHLIAVCKPDGILTQGDQTGDVALFEAVRQHLEADANARDADSPRRPFLGLVHRLDRPVWGVVVFAKSSKVAAGLSEQFREGSVQKTYLAVIEGLPDELEGRLSGYLLRREGMNSRIFDKPVRDSQEVVLEYKVATADAERSVLEINPKTGRKHQIRAQLAHFGFPIIGDFRYGSRVKLPGERLALMAKRLRFRHPVTGREVKVVAPEPPWWPWQEAKKKPPTFRKPRKPRK